MDREQTVFDGDITLVHGIRVGQAENAEARTGCTVVLCHRDGAVGGVSVRGAAPGQPWLRGSRVRFAAFAARTAASS